MAISKTVIAIFVVVTVQMVAGQTNTPLPPLWTQYPEGDTDAKCSKLYAAFDVVQHTFSVFQQSLQEVAGLGEELALLHGCDFEVPTTLSNEAISPQPTPSIPSHSNCTGSFVIERGQLLEFSSPNFPDYYQNNANCEWKISTHYGSSSTFNIRFSHFETEPAYDYVEVGFGNTTWNSYSGSYSPDVISISAPSVWVRFRSDGSNVHPGFQFSVEVLRVLAPLPPLPTWVPTCTGSYFIERGQVLEFSSPNFPDYYHNNANCEWLFSTHYGPSSPFNIRFIHFQTEPAYDYVEVGFGNTTLNSYSGLHLPNNILGIWAPSVWVRFRSDGSNRFSGFQFSVEVLAPPTPSLPSGPNCTGSYSIERGQVLEFSSPSFPDYYQNNVNCEWLISTHYGSSSTFNIHFQTEPGYDIIAVGVGNTTLHSYTGLYLPGNILGIRAPSVWVRFRSDGSNLHPGFQFSVEVLG